MSASQLIIDTNLPQSNFIIITQNSYQTKKVMAFQHLTPTQLDERKVKGLCFNCDVKIHYRHVCKSKSFALVVINKDNEYIDEN